MFWFHTQGDTQVFYRYFKMAMDDSLPFLQKLLVSPKQQGLSNQQERRKYTTTTTTTTTILSIQVSLLLSIIMLIINDRKRTSFI